MKVATILILLAVLIVVTIPRIDAAPSTSKKVEPPQEKLAAPKATSTTYYNPSEDSVYWSTTRESVARDIAAKEYGRAERSLKECLSRPEADKRLHSAALMHGQLGSLLMEQNRLDEALIQYQAALKKDELAFPNNATIVHVIHAVHFGPDDSYMPIVVDLQAIASVYKRKGQKNEALASLARAQSLFDHFPAKFFKTRSNIKMQHDRVMSQKSELQGH